MLVSNIELGAVLQQQQRAACAAAVNAGAVSVRGGQNNNKKMTKKIKKKKKTKRVNAFLTLKGCSNKAMMKEQKKRLGAKQRDDPGG